jgi:hypothetical protein
MYSERNPLPNLRDAQRYIAASPSLPLHEFFFLLVVVDNKQLQQSVISVKVDWLGNT